VYLYSVGRCGPRPPGGEGGDKMNLKFLLLSVPCALMMVPHDVRAAVRVSNASRGQAAYNQTGGPRGQTPVIQQNVVNQNPQMGSVNAATADNAVNAAATEVKLPIRVANAALAQQIARGDTNARASMANLESCANIYLNGEFAWDTPTVGMGAGGAGTCVAVVEIRGYQMGANGSDLVLARANLASGDAVKCNISEFPEASYTTDAMNVVFPADNEPTMDDVIRIMNDEQKKDAGIKIVAGTIIGGLAGNMAGKNEIGHDGLLGGGKHKTQGTLIGAATGAALMAGNAYAGKKGGDVILSTGVNAAAGGVVGNMVASGDSVLRIEDCTVDGSETKCLWGMIATNNPIKDTQTAFFNIDDGYTTVVCDADMKNCETKELIAIKLDVDAYRDKDLDEISEKQFEEIRADSNNQYHLVQNPNGKPYIESGFGENGIYAKIKSAGTIDRQIAAMIPVGNALNKTFGAKKSDWRKWKQANSSATVYGRSPRGEPYRLPDNTEYDLNDFYPMMLDAEDGGLIDFGNKARLKSTLIGAGAGGALGAFVGYQGAQSDIENRWVSAVREYKDSLQKFYCTTGTRFLGYYNDTIVIPNM